MSARIAGGHALPPNPVYLDFGKSDGDTKQLPTNTREVVDADGQVNYMKPLELDDSSNIHWRSQVAMKVAERLGRPSGKNYVLRSWPEGYHLYCHLKGKQSAPRQDLYLLGSVHAKRFRSVPEFVPHALWLMTDPTLDRRNCECKYCAKVPQRVISENLGYKHRTTPGSSPAPGLGMHRVGRDRERRSPRTAPGEYATVRRAPKPKPEKGPTQIMLQERYADVQAMYADTDAEMRRWFRVGELVWCALDPPIRGTDAAANITFWPGLVDECSFKAEALPRPKSPSIHSADGDFEMEDGTESTPAVAHVGQGIGTSNGAGGSNVAIPYAITPHPGNPKSVTERPLPWTVRQKNVYKVKLLAVNHDYIAVETQVLPYHCYKPSYDLLQALQDVPIEQITHKPEEIAAFNPCPPEAELSNTEPSANDRYFAEATAPYTLAMEIAAGIEVCWTPTDEWVFKMVVPSPDAGETSARALQSLSVVNQTRYQGLWLGAERIWTDDLVRLKAARGQIAPKGTPQILVPSGPSKTSIAAFTPDQLADQEFMKAQGAPGRGVFMQLEALFVVDVPDASGAGLHAECRGSGMLYELADEDWEEPPLGESRSETEEGGPENAAQDAWTAAGLSTPPRQRKSGVTPELHVGQPFMSAPSPLKHLPSNQDATASASTPPRERKNPPKETTTTARPDADAPNTQLSRSSKLSAVPLPPAPRGFRFRPILPEGYEVVVSLALVTGRYYPRLLAHPLLRPIVRNLRGDDVNEPATKPVYDRLFALEGILPGFVSASEATRWKPSRPTMVRDAAAERSAVLARVWDSRRREAQEAAAAQQEPVLGATAATVATESGQSQGDDVGMHDLESLAIGASTPTDLQEMPPAQSVTAT
ncbi:hypothetical protein BJY52DRAFT_1125022 [Lactarius psammicola]|nr:hypothetical protein BJY52DRAFT_1125022 [Lactarius psammicola]